VIARLGLALASGIGFTIGMALSLWPLWMLPLVALVGLRLGELLR